jgi:ribulose-phosphate 3-epimerase
MTQHTPAPRSAAADNLARVTSILESQGPVVLPALLLCDFGHLAREVERLEAAGAVALHLDIMDGRFVPQLTYGPVVVEAVRRAAGVPLEVHLMIEEPERSLADYAELGAEIITVHAEALADPSAALDEIRSLGCRAHLAISPGTPVSRIEPFLDACDGVLVMSVEPGYGGQQFEPQALDKLARLAAIRRETGGRFRLGVDGGISTTTIAAAAAAGAELIVAGSAVIRAADYSHAIDELESLARGAI